MLISHGGWFMFEGAPSLMLQLREAGTAGFARSLGLVVRLAPEIQTTSLPRSSAPVLSTPAMTRIVLAPMQREVCASAPFTFQSGDDNTLF